MSQAVENSGQPPRVYIKNLNYYTTEEELEAFLKDFEPVNVLIPSYTIRFSRSEKHKPLGIAYAEFKSTEQAEKVVKQLNGTFFKSRSISVKHHVPFTPKVRKFGFNRLSNKTIKQNDKKKERGKENDNEVVNEDVEERDEKAPASNIESATTTDGASLSINSESESLEIKKSSDLSLKVVKEQIPVSKDTIFIGKVPFRTTDVDIRDYFKEYSPTQIYIYKGTRKSRHGSIHLKHRYVNALVTVNVNNVLDEIIKEVGSKKLNGKYVKLKPAYLSKIDEVKKAAKLTESEEVKENKEEKQKETKEVEDVADSNAKVEYKPKKEETKEDDSEQEYEETTEYRQIEEQEMVEEESEKEIHSSATNIENQVDPTEGLIKGELIDI